MSSRKEYCHRKEKRVKVAHLLTKLFLKSSACSLFKQQLLTNIAVVSAQLEGKNIVINYHEIDSCATYEPIVDPWLDYYEIDRDGALSPCNSAHELAFQGNLKSSTATLVCRLSWWQRYRLQQ